MSTKEAKPAAPPKGVIPPTAPGGRSGFLSDVIVDLGFAEREAVEQAVRAARSPGTTVARVLVESGAITEEQLAHATAERYGIAYIDLGSFAVEASAANLIKPSAAKRYQAVPVGFVGGGLLVAMADPADALGVNDIAVMTKMDVKPAVASRPALDALLEALPLIEDSDGGDAGSQVAAEDPARDYAAAEEPAPSASSAVFWQADDDGGNGVQESLPEDAEPEPPAADDRRQRGDLAAARGARPGDRPRPRRRARCRGGRSAPGGARLGQEGAQAGTRRRGRAHRGDGLAARAAHERGDRARASARGRRGGGCAARAARGPRGRAGAVALGGRVTPRHRGTRPARRSEEAEHRIEELEDADRRAEQARQALAEMREENERQREQQLIEERELRAQLEEAAGRRGELEERLAEVESSAFAAERAFEELRGAQQRMREALRALAGDAESESEQAED